MLPKIVVCLWLLALPVFSQTGATGVRSSRNVPERPREAAIVLDGAHKPADCAVERDLVQKELQTLQFPPGWTLVIACTQLRWDALFHQLHPPYTRFAFTGLADRVTVLNGAMFHEFPPNYRHVIAHELAHVKCNCSDEQKAEELAFRLEKNGTAETHVSAKPVAAPAIVADAAH